MQQHVSTWIGGIVPFSNPSCLNTLLKKKKQKPKPSYRHCQNSLDPPGGVCAVGLPYNSGPNFINMRIRVRPFERLVMHKTPRPNIKFKRAMNLNMSTQLNQSEWILACLAQGDKGTECLPSWEVLMYEGGPHRLGLCDQEKRKGFILLGYWML